MKQMDPWPVQQVCYFQLTSETYRKTQRYRKAGRIQNSNQIFRKVWRWNNYIKRFAQTYDRWMGGERNSIQWKTNVNCTQNDYGDDISITTVGSIPNVVTLRKMWRWYATSHETHVKSQNEDLIEKVKK